jgi:hypothetical protein
MLSFTNNQIFSATAAMSDRQVSQKYFAPASLSTIIPDIGIRPIVVTSSDPKVTHFISENRQFLCRRAQNQASYETNEPCLSILRTIKPDPLLCILFDRL